MYIFHPTIYMIDLRTCFRIYYLNCIKHFTVRRFILTTCLYLILIPLILINIVGRLIDEILFIGYRRKPIHKPVFIISNPRSGTTLLQELLASDQSRFITLKLFHTLFFFILYYKIIALVSRIDQRIGAPVTRFFQWISRTVFRGWKGIHPMGLDEPEEDEGFWFFSFLSPAWSLFTPFLKDLRYLNIMDDRPAREKKLMGLYYRNFLRRFAYGQGEGRLLIKSVMSSGKIHMLLSLFPNTRVIYIERSPEKTVPSYISMFSVPWRIHSPEAGIPEYQSVGQSAIDFYRHMHDAQNVVPPGQLLRLPYDDLKADPMQVIERIYHFLEEPLSDEQRLRLQEKIREKRHYRSRHTYSMKEYGYTAESLWDALGLPDVNSLSSR